ncbi:MAG: DUF1127 domain-containing protein [bacterium]
MTLFSNNIRYKPLSVPDYRSQDRFNRQLQGFSSFAGISHWQTGSRYDPNFKQYYSDRGHTIRSRVVVGLFNNLRDAVSRGFSDTVSRIVEKRRLHLAVRQLSVLNDRALKDIGVTRDDIASIASGAVTIEQINQRRRALTVSSSHLGSRAKPSLVKIDGENTPAQEYSLDQAA